MGLFLTLSFLFFLGSIIGFLLEVVFRRFFSSSNPERKWINPGFCTGPYLPLYGIGLCALYLIAVLEFFCPFSQALWNKLFLFGLMALCMTAIEYVAGIFCLKVLKVRLWDYRDEVANIQGIICPKFSMFWAILGALYYFLIHPFVVSSVRWLSENLAFSFVIGLFFGVFLIDVAHSAHLMAKLKTFADENDVIVRYESIKAGLRHHREHSAGKYHFFRPFQTDRPLTEQLREMRGCFDKRIHKKITKDRRSK